MLRQKDKGFSKIYKVLVWMEPTIPSIRAFFHSLYVWINVTAPGRGRAASCVTYIVIQQQFKPVSPWVVQVLLWHCPRFPVPTPLPPYMLSWQLKVKLVEGVSVLSAKVWFCCLKICAATCWGTHKWEVHWSGTNRSPERRRKGSEVRQKMKEKGKGKGEKRKLKFTGLYS